MLNRAPTALTFQHIIYIKSEVHVYINESYTKNRKPTERSTVVHVV